MSELADKLRSRNTDNGIEGWFRKEQKEAEAAANASIGAPASSGENDQPAEPRVFVVPSAASPEETSPAEQPDADTPPRARKHALARKPPFWLNRPCPVWCQSEHHDHDLPVDRRHVSAPEGSVLLIEAEAVQANDGSWQPQDIHVALTQHVREVEPLISCGGHGPAGAWHLTLAEARELAAALARAVAAAEAR